jgi:DNA ligase (NAD+)
MARKPKDIPHIDPDAIADRDQAAEALAELRRAIRYHDHRYYVLDDPVISDAQYDRLYDQLLRLEEDYPDLVTPDSPSQRVGGAPREELGTVAHPVPMLSLQAVYEAEAVERFDRNCREEADGKVQYVAEPKYDGLAVELVYEEGVLVAGATRGDGDRGEDVLANLKTVGEVALKLQGDEARWPRRLVARGEVYMRRDEFETLNDRRRQAGASTFANPRNAAAGALRQLDPKTTAARPLHIFLYAAPICRGREFGTHWQVLEALAQWGLKVNRTEHRLCENLEQAFDYHREMAERRDALPYEIDGVVFKVNNLSQRERLGLRQRDPRWALAYKFAPRRAATRVTEITVQVGRTGALTPVAHLEPVQIGGVEVRRASLHNPHQVAQRDIRIGDRVLVERAGDVIPQVVGPVSAERSGGQKRFHMPEKCPVCGQEVVISEDRKDARCTNVSCPAQLAGRLAHLASKEALDIDGLGSKRIRQLMDAGLVTDLPSLFGLEKKDLLGLEGYADKSAQNLLDALDRARKTTLERLLYGLGIPRVGAHGARLLAERFADLDALAEASAEDLKAIDEIGPEMARCITAFFANPRNRENIEGLRRAGLEVENPLSGPGGKAPLADLTFVFTGRLEAYSRSAAKRRVEDLGGRATSAVSGQTDYLVAGPGGGRKLAQAREAGVEILDEEAFLELLKKKGGR